jgi:hypothetical protein
MDFMVMILEAPRGAPRRARLAGRRSARPERASRRT